MLNEKSSYANESPRCVWNLKYSNGCYSWTLSLKSFLFTSISHSWIHPKRWAFQPLCTKHPNPSCLRLTPQIARQLLTPLQRFSITSCGRDLALGHKLSNNSQNFPIYYLLENLQPWKSRWAFYMNVLTSGTTLKLITNYSWQWLHKFANWQL